MAADHVIKNTRRVVGDARTTSPSSALTPGIGATLRLLEANLKVILTERGAFGGTIMHYPRARSSRPARARLRARRSREATKII